MNMRRVVYSTDTISNKTRNGTRFLRNSFNEMQKRGHLGKSSQGIPVRLSGCTANDLYNDLDSNPSYFKPVYTREGVRNCETTHELNLEFMFESFLRYP